MSNLHELAAVALPNTVACNATVPSPQSIDNMAVSSNRHIVLMQQSDLMIIAVDQLAYLDAAKRLAYRLYHINYRVRVIVEGIEVIRLMNWSKKGNNR